MSSPNIIKDTSQLQNVNHSSMEKSLLTDIDELESKFINIRNSYNSHNSHNQQQKICSDSKRRCSIARDTTIKMQSLDIQSKLRAIRVFNVFLAKVWRRRCHEVSDLQDLIKTYRTNINSLRDNLFVRNNMMCRERQRSDRLELELRKMKSNATTISHNCAAVDKAMNEARANEIEMREELERKTNENKNLSELLNANKTEMIRELAKNRESSQQLAMEQRQNMHLEMQNSELEDEILNLKDKFQAQHDDHALVLFAKQEKLDEAYEQLKHYEQELAQLEIRHNELRRQTESYAKYAAAYMISQRSGFFGNLLRLQRIRLPNCKFFIYELITKFFDYIVRGPFAVPSAVPATSMGVCLALMFLIGSYVT